MNNKHKQDSRKTVMTVLKGAGLSPGKKVTDSKFQSPHLPKKHPAPQTHCHMSNALLLKHLPTPPMHPGPQTHLDTPNTVPHLQCTPDHTSNTTPHLLMHPPFVAKNPTPIFPQVNQKEFDGTFCSPQSLYPAHSEATTLSLHWLAALSADSSRLNRA